MRAQVAPARQASLFLRVTRFGLLVTPLALLTVAGLRFRRDSSDLIWVGVLIQAVACLFFLSRGRGWRGPIGVPEASMYVVALAWLAFAVPDARDGFLYLSRSLLIVVPLGFFAALCLHESGATDLRRARRLADRLANRRTWPADLDACRFLPEVRALRDSLRIDAGPAFGLLSQPLPQVRIAALAALQGRKVWQPGQAEVIVHMIRHTAEPEVRAAGIAALAAREDRETTEAIAEFLRDADRRVREVTADALLWSTEKRWPWIRDAVRQALASPTCQGDGPLCPEGHVFSEEAVTDLNAWACEKGLLGLRAALTLGAHAEQVLASAQDPKLAEKLRLQVADSHAPALLRLELARVLQRNQELDEQTLRKMMSAISPAPLRLIAVEARLIQGESPEATGVLCELARLPNREIALATADVVQRRLGVDLGLPRHQALPPVQSRQATDVARRLQAWATRLQGSPADEAEVEAW
jgi:hypothetical protein